MFETNVAIGTWFSQLQQASSEFIIDGRVTWVEIEGIPLKIWSENTVKHIASKWGVLLHVDGQDDGCFHRKRIANFNKEYVSVGQNYDRSEDPFNIYGLLNKRQDDKNKGSISVESRKYPPGFTPMGRREVHSNEVNESKRESVEGCQSTHEEEVVTGIQKNGSKNKSKEDIEGSVCLCHFKKPEVPCSGSLILQLMENLVKVGQTMGYNMEGCMKNMEEIIASQGVKEVN
ncbi:nucleotide-binding alpha-beta plait domain-containing protein [Tanacetum coccineum]